MQRYQNQFFNAILPYTKYNIDATEEILQEAWINILNSLKKFDLNRNFFSWAFTIIMKTSQKIIQKTNKHDKNLDVFEEHKEQAINFQNEGNQLEENFIQDEDKKLLREALISLDEIEYLCIYLKFFENKKIAEIIEIIGKSRSTVFEIINRAKNKIKNKLT